MSDTETLKPCPFCGSEDFYFSGVFRAQKVICNGCGASSKMFSDNEPDNMIINGKAPMEYGEKERREWQIIKARLIKQNKDKAIEAWNRRSNSE